MKVGDLVQFADSEAEPTVCIVTKVKDVRDIHSGVLLHSCVMIAIPEEEAIIPMNKKFLQVISESR